MTALDQAISDLGVRQLAQERYAYEGRASGYWYTLDAENLVRRAQFNDLTMVDATGMPIWWDPDTRFDVMHDDRVLLRNAVADFPSDVEEKTGPGHLRYIITTDIENGKEIRH